MNEYQVDQPGIHELLQELRALVDEYDDRVLVGEIDEITYYGDGTNELHMVFNFPLMRTKKLTPAWIRTNQNDRLGVMPAAAWPCNTLGNHDAPRVYSRYGDGEHNDQIARLSLALMLTLKGTPFLYNGEEIGMRDFLLPSIDLFRDNLGIWVYREMTENFGAPAEKALKVVQTLTRDKCRTPMQWSSTANAGFSPAEVQTWLPVNPDYAAGINVTQQRGKPKSMLNFYKLLLSVRKSTPALIEGDYKDLSGDSDKIFAFLRSTSAQRCLVALSYSDQPEWLNINLDSPAGKLIFSSDERGKEVDLPNLELAPFEILIVRLTQ